MHRDKGEKEEKTNHLLLSAYQLSATSLDSLLNKTPIADQQLPYSKSTARCLDQSNKKWTVYKHLRCA